MNWGGPGNVGAAWCGLRPKILQAPLLGGPRSAVPASASLESGPRVLAAGDQGSEPSQDAPRRSRFAVGSRHRHARSRGSRLTAGVRPGIRPLGCLARARLGAIAPLVDVAHPLLDRRLPLLLGRRDVLDQAPGAEGSGRLALLLPAVRSPLWTRRRRSST